MTSTMLAERNRAFDEAESAQLAIQAGMLLTRAQERGMPDIVLSRAAPVREWLIPGSGREGDMRARRRALSHHMQGLAEAAKACGGLATCTPRELIAGAEKYYQALTGEKQP